MEAGSRAQVATTNRSKEMSESIKIPNEIRTLLLDIAKIRQTILENAPQCLPAIAPVIIDAEEHLHAMWER